MTPPDGRRRGPRRGGPPRGRPRPPSSPPPPQGKRHPSPPPPPPRPAPPPRRKAAPVPPPPPPQVRLHPLVGHGGAGDVHGAVDEPRPLQRRQHVGHLLADLHQHHGVEGLQQAHQVVDAVVGRHDGDPL